LSSALANTSTVEAHGKRKRCSQQHW